MEPASTLAGFLLPFRTKTMPAFFFNTFSYNSSECSSVNKISEVFPRILYMRHCFRGGLFSETQMLTALGGKTRKSSLLRARRGTRKPNLQVVITHVLHVYSQHSFGLPLRMNEMYRKMTQFDQAQ